MIRKQIMVGAAALALAAAGFGLYWLGLQRGKASGVPLPAASTRGVIEPRVTSAVRIPRFCCTRGLTLIWP